MQSITQSRLARTGLGIYRNSMNPMQDALQPWIAGYVHLQVDLWCLKERKERFSRSESGISHWCLYGVYLSTYLCPGFPWEAWPCSPMMKRSSSCNLHRPLHMETLERSLTCCFVFEASIWSFTLNKFSQFLVCIIRIPGPLKAQTSRSHPQGFWPSKS